MRPFRIGMRPRTALPKVVFPEPDSPTSPTVFPFWKSSEISLRMVLYPLSRPKKPDLSGYPTLRDST